MQSKGLLHLTGRRKESAIWDYFKFEAATNKSICQVTVSAKCRVEGVEKSEICGAKLSGQNASNLKTHLRTCHKLECSEFENKEKTRKISLQKPSRVDVDQRVSRGQIINFLRKGNNSRVMPLANCKVLEKAVVNFFSASGLSTHMANEPFFRELLSTFQPKFIVPGRGKVNRLLTQQYDSAVAILKTELKAARRMTICLDIWSKKSLASSFLGISANYFDPEAQTVKHRFLNLYNVQHPHTGQRIADYLYQCVEAWGIPAEKILLVVTDNGSNMIKAIKIIKEERNGIHPTQDSSNAMDIQEENNEEMDGNVESDGDMESDSEVDNGPAEGIVVDTVYELEKEMEELLNAVHLTRMACMPHTLQLVVKEIYKQPNCYAVITKAASLVKSVRKSSILVEKLIRKCGKTLVLSCATRWNSTLMMLCRLLDVKAALTEVLDEECRDGLLVSEWTLIDHMCKFLEPLAHHTNMLQTDSSSLSCVIPSVLDIEAHLHTTPYCRSVANTMLKDMKRRFADILDPMNSNFNPVPAAACLLDPAMPSVLLQPNLEPLLTAAKNFISNLVTIISTCQLFTFKS
jgi:hypothetical protein